MKLHKCPYLGQIISFKRSAGKTVRIRKKKLRGTVRQYRKYTGTSGAKGKEKTLWCYATAQRTNVNRWVRVLWESKKDNIRNIV